MNAQEFHPDQAQGISSRHQSFTGVQSAILVADSLNPGNLGQVLDEPRAEGPRPILDFEMECPEPSGLTLLGK